jgi:N-ethylmaleimide reductase
MVEYYTQRASEGGLIIAEATPVSIRGSGYAGAPGIYSDRQIEGWRRVTDAVHAKGGRIVLQLWHVGRQSHTDLHPSAGAPVAPSAIPAEGHAYSKNGEVPFSMPRALALHEIPAIVEEFRGAPSGCGAPGSTASRFTARTGTCPTSFCRTAPTSAPTTMAAGSRIAPASCWR